MTYSNVKKDVTEQLTNAVKRNNGDENLPVSRSDQHQKAENDDENLISQLNRRELRISVIYRLLISFTSVTNKSLNFCVVPKFQQGTRLGVTQM